MQKLVPILVFAMALSGCAATEASNRDTLPAANVIPCRSLCDSTGIPLQSIVIVANQTGCVCGNASAGGSAAATGGAAAVMLAQQQEQQQQQQQQRR